PRDHAARAVGPAAAEGACESGAAAGERAAGPPPEADRRAAGRSALVPRRRGGPPHRDVVRGRAAGHGPRRLLPRVGDADLAARPLAQTFTGLLYEGWLAYFQHRLDDAEAAAEAALLIRPGAADARELKVAVEEQRRARP